MKHTALVAIILFFCTTVVGQNLQKKISLDTKDVSLPELIKYIENEYSIDFSYNPNLLPQEKNISILATDLPLSLILDGIVKGHSISYKEINGQIVLSRKKQTQNQQGKKRPATKQIEYKTIYDTIVEYQYDTITSVNFDTIIVVDSIQHFDTIIVVDTIQYFDTLHVFDHMSSKTKYYCQTYYSFPLYTNLTGNRHIKDYSSQITSFGIALGRNFNWGNIDIGGRFTFFSDRYSLDQTAIVLSTKTTETETSFVPETRKRQYYSIPIGTADTIWRSVDETVFSEKTDTVVIEKTDTIQYRKHTEVRRNAQFVTIPIQYSYTVHIKKMAFAPSVGFDLQFLIASEEIVSGDKIESESTFCMFSANINGGVWCEYPVSDYFSFFASPMLSYPCTPILSSGGQDNSLVQGRLLAGISYKF